MSERDYYEILGLNADADGTTVNKTYWNLARKYQALATSDPRAHTMLDELNEAYNVLGTPALRDEYQDVPLTRFDSLLIRSKEKKAPVQDGNDSASMATTYPV